MGNCLYHGLVQINGLRRFLHDKDIRLRVPLGYH